MYKCCIFDLDGTLLNTLEDLADAMNWVCEQHGWPVHTLEEYKYFVGNGASKLVERAAPAGTAFTRELLGEFTGRYSARKAEKTTSYPGLPEAVSQLRTAGVKLAVLGGFAWIGGAMALCQPLPEHFSAVFMAAALLPVIGFLVSAIRFAAKRKTR